MQKYLEQAEKYLKAQQLQKIYLSADQQDLFFLKSVDSAIYLFHLNMSLQTGNIDLSQAKKILSLNFAKCNFEFVEFFSKQKFLYFLLDEKHNEFSNLFRLDLAKLDAGVQQITSVKDAKSFNWSKDHRTLYFSNRYPVENGLFRNEFYRMDLASGKLQFLFDDQNWIYKVGWVGFRLSECEKFILIGLDKNNKRELTNFAKYDLSEVQNLSLNNPHPSEPKRILPDLYEDAGNYFLPSITDKGFYFVSDFSKFENLYYFNFDDNVVEVITDSQWINLSATVLKTNSNSFFVIAEPLKKTNKTRFLSIDLTSRSLVEKTVDGQYEIANNQPYLVKMAFDQVPTIVFYNKDFDFSRSFSKYVGDNLVHCTYEVVEYSSFDQLNIFSYLVMPKVPLKAVVVVAFYGGENYYHFHKQLFLENGIAIFSPAVRGSWGWGRQWEDHLKNDLGGKEILDVIWAAKFISNYLKLPENKIGLWGASHGGYATLRALTFPSEFFGVSSQFDFGFGICECGFADLEDFYLTSRIADWLVDLLGEYPQNKSLYVERSPITLFENLKTPLFIRHGTSDSRVPLSTMKSFIERLQNPGLKHEVMIQPDQGHHTNDPEKLKVERARILKFIESVIL